MTVAVFVSLLLFCTMEPFKNPDKKITSISIIYDNYSSVGNTLPDWGFSCLIEGLEKTVLFDTGAKPHLFERNAKEMKVNFKEIDALVISHNHQDHTGCIKTVLDQNPAMPIYFPRSSTGNYLANHPAYKENIIEVKEAIPVCEGLILTGELPGQAWEQSIVLETHKGLVIITGCAHPGILEIVNRVRELKSGPIYMVLGGFHLMRHKKDAVLGIIRAMQAIGVQQCGASHCTGEEAIKMFRTAYGDDFIDLGTGSRIEIPL